MTKSLESLKKAVQTLPQQHLVHPARSFSQLSTKKDDKQTEESAIKNFKLISGQDLTNKIKQNP